VPPPRCVGRFPRRPSWRVFQPMSSQPARTQRTTAPPRASGYADPAPPQAQGAGLQIGTLVIAAIAAVIAATVVSRFWQAGTIMATAMTPVIVALVKEGLERPARRVSSMATRAATPSPVARASRRVVEPPPEAYAPPPPVVGPDDELSEMRVYRRERTVGGRGWKLAVATGLLACVIAVAAMTLPELVAGRSVVSGSHHTTIFGGHRSTSTTTKSKTDTQKPSTDEQKSTSTETQPQDTTTQPDTTTTAPGQTTPGQTQTQPQPAVPQGQTQPPAETQPTQPPAQQTQPPATTP
jgi:hypothetical protein